MKFEHLSRVIMLPCAKSWYCTKNSLPHIYHIHKYRLYTIYIVYSARYLNENQMKSSLLKMRADAENLFTSPNSHIRACN